MTIQGFWGLTLEPGKTYSQIVKAPFHVTMASLEEDKSNGRSTIYVSIENKSFSLCTLIPNKIDQQLLDIFFVEGELVTFMVKGESTISLIGNYVFPNVKPKLDTTKTFLKGASENNDKMQGQQCNTNEPLPNNNAKIINKKKVRNTNKNIKQMSGGSPKTEKNEGKQLKVKKGKNLQQGTRKTKVVDFPDKLLIEDLQLGKGPVCKTGHKVEIIYIGQFINGTYIVEKEISKSFQLGKEEVFKGMELGITNMKVGGKRRLTIPPSLAYGEKGFPPFIPENATLIFEVQLVSITL